MAVKYKIDGKNHVFGTIKISGAKNFSIKAIAASLLANGTSHFFNLPNNLDVHKTLSMLRALGADVYFDTISKQCSINTTNISNILQDSSNTNMTTFLIAAALLNRFEDVSFPKMRGCNLGDRLSDFHILAFNQFGVECVEQENGYLLKKIRPLVGAFIELPYPSVGATETCLFLASISSGHSVIKNIAIEPEINALITLLIEMGVDVFFEADRTIRVIGSQELTPIANGFIHGDYLEASTWAVLAAINDGNIIVEGVVPELIGSFLGVFSMLGGDYRRISHDSIAFFKGHAAKKSILLETGVFPMLRTDLQPLLAVMASLLPGSTTLIHETVYNNRLDYILDFNSFGCDLIGLNECVGNKCRYFCNHLHSAVIKGVSNVTGQKGVVVKTVRSGMANILLATVAQGSSEIFNVELVERGYCSLFEKLKSVGVSLEREELIEK